MQMYALPLWTTSQLQNNAMLILRGMKVEAPWHISMPMCLKANFTLHASGTKPLKEFAFQQNITFPCLFLNLCPNGAPISHFLASVHNHFCVKLSSLSCNKQKKMPVEKVFFFFFFFSITLPGILLSLGVLVSGGDFLECTMCFIFC